MTQTKPTPAEENAAMPETKVGADKLTEEAGRSWRGENKKIMLAAVVVGLFMAVAHFTPLRGWITNVQTWKGYVREIGWPAHGAFAVVCATSVMVGIPRLPLCAVAGLVFGFAEGVLLSITGSTLGSYGAFLLARFGGRRAVLTRAKRWPWIAPLLQTPSWIRVFWVRQLMLPGVVLNVLLGVSTVRHYTFLAGTLLGYLPLNIAFCLVGSGLGKDSLAKTLMQLLTAMGVINIIGWAVWRMAKNGLNNGINCKGKTNQKQPRTRVVKRGTQTAGKFTETKL